MTLQRVKSKLVQEVDTIESESKCLENFKSELNLLVQEKMAHLEELRQIQNDISVVSLRQRVPVNASEVCELIRLVRLVS